MIGRVRGARCALGVLVLVACGGAPAPKVEVKPKPVATVKPPPPPTRARWVFAHPESGFAAKIDAGDGATLYVGQRGRRALAKGGELKAAETLAFDDLVGVLRDGKSGFAFVADDGDITTASDPLGALGPTRPGPVPDPKGGQQRLGSTSTGKLAVMGISPVDHALLRTTDLGATWASVSYLGGDKAFGRPLSLALDGKGNGLLLHYPQRLFVTHDDGATWKPISSPGIGGRSVKRDGNGSLFLFGWSGKHALLDGDKLTETTASLAGVYEAPKPDARVSPPEENVSGQKTVLAGDRAVELTEISRHGKVREVRVASAKLGEKADKTINVPDLIGKSGLSSNVDGFGSDLVYLREDDDADENAPTSTIFLSHDYGATWQKDATVQGNQVGDEYGGVHVGPKGWAYVPSLCASHDAPDESGDAPEPEDEDRSRPYDSDSCSHRQIRPAGAAAFEDFAYTESFTPTSFAFDAARDKVYALGTREGSYYLYESPLSANKFTRSKAFEGALAYDSRITVDDKGAVRALKFDSSKQAWSLLRRDADGKEQPKEWVQLPYGMMSVVGPRALLFTHDKAFESADGGESWVRVATSGVYSMDCAEAGCVDSAATARVGWDLPAAAADAKTLAVTELPKAVAPPAPPPAQTPDVAPLELACKVSGKATPIMAMPDMKFVDARTSDVRWASYRTDPLSQATVVLVGGKSTTREISLLPAAAPSAKNETRSGVMVLDDGVVAGRYSFLPRSTTGTLNPVDVELGWWSAQTGKTSRHTLPKQPAFRVSRYGFSGTAQIVDGGLLYQTSYGEPVQFIQDDGRVGALAAPGGVGLDYAARFGKRWMLAQWDGAQAMLWWSDDGASWSSKAWGLDDGGSMSLTSIGGKPAIAVQHGALTKLLFGAETPNTDEPPVPTVVSTSRADVACDATRGKERFWQFIPNAMRKMHARVASADAKDAVVVDLTGGTRITHDTAAGGTCTAAYAVNGTNPKTGAQENGLVYLDASGWSGWRFRPGAEAKERKTLAEPISCAPAK